MAEAGYPTSTASLGLNSQIPDVTAEQARAAAVQVAGHVLPTEILPILAMLGLTPEETQVTP
ncbi:MAG: hypothetical protein EPO52_17550 [Herbiconiux sp.]|uniref:hypothetical protein n=1 Tax=Herbiconiux sp. TaxID=1871186 RepID=UPI001207DDE7|nr:hypothetical protein [Herbiconiux sp.]TAJ46338.1 MAG: hypothetical protein EPO52_17550 [Herbiconiux sp.]